MWSVVDPCVSGGITLLPVSLWVSSARVATSWFSPWPASGHSEYRGTEHHSSPATVHSLAHPLSRLEKRSHRAKIFIVYNFLNLFFNNSELIMEHYLLAFFLYGLDSARPAILPFSFTKRSFESTTMNVKLSVNSAIHHARCLRLYITISYQRLDFCGL